MEEKKYLTIINEFGKEEKYEIVLVYKSTRTMKNYVVYTDNTYKDNKLNIYASVFYPEDSTRFEDVETEEEWDEIKELLDISFNEES